ncbi:MAG: HAD family hydrolase [Planctomycetes bacterium]|nr:HAD family hydrolase [Planctomycetota bacterium]
MSDTQIKGVIFDLDGTLVDSYEAIYLGFQYAYHQMGLKPLSCDEVKNQVGYSLQHIFTELLGKEKVPQAVVLFRRKYEEVFKTHTRLLPDVKEVLIELHTRGIKLSVATNKLGRFSRAILEHLQVGHLFSAIIGEGDVSRNKPDPEMVCLAIEKMGVLKQNAVLVGDSCIDIQTAHNADIRVYAVPSGTTSKEDLAKACPTVVIARLSNFPDYI